jgi:tetratricopeptide (TPR) repeat protein
MKTIKVFLASSEELKYDRIDFGDMVRQLNEIFKKRDIEIKLLKWEDFDASYTGQRKQDEYNAKITDSDIFIALFHTKAGKYTLEEVDCAIDGFNRKKSPRIYLYVREVKDGESETPDLVQFKEHVLHNLGHYTCSYDTTDALKLNFILQLEASEGDGLQQENLMKVGEQSVSVDGKKIVDLNNVPFVSRNSEYNRLKEQLAQLDKEIAGLRLSFAADPTSTSLLTELVGKSGERNKVNEAFEKCQSSLYDTALRFTKLSGEKYSARIAKAREYFEKGDSAKADEVLNEAEMKSETRQELAQFEEYRSHLETIIEEWRLKARTSMSNESLPIPERFKNACNAYDEALGIADTIRYDKAKEAGILFDYGKLLQKFNHFDESEIKYKKALSLYRQLEKENPGNFLPRVALSLNNLGNIHLSLHRYEEAEKEYREALGIRDSLAEKNYDMFIIDVSKTLNNLGNLHSDLHHYEEAEKEYNKSLKIKRSLAEKDPDAFLPYVATSLMGLGNLHSDLHRYEESEKEKKESLEIYRSLASKNPDAYLPYVAMSLGNLGNLHLNLHRYEESEKEYKESLEIYRSLASKNPDAYLPYVAMSLGNLGNLHSDLHHYEEAEKEYKESLEIYRSLASKNPDAYMPNVATSLNNLGNLHSALHRYEESEKEKKESLELYRFLASKNPDAFLPNVATSLISLGALHSDLHRYEESEKEYKEALEIQRSLAAKNPDAFLPDVALNLGNLGNLHRDLHHYEESEKEYRESLDIRRSLAAKNPDAYLPDVAIESQ